MWLYVVKWFYVAKVAKSDERWEKCLIVVKSGEN